MNLRVNGPRMREFLTAVAMCWPGRREEIEPMMDLERGIELTIKPIKLGRSRDQENYYRKGLHLLGAEIGMKPKEADGDLHDHILCAAFGVEKTVRLPNGSVKEYPRKRSADVTQAEYSSLIETLQMAAADMGIYIPDAEERE